MGIILCLQGIAILGEKIGTTHFIGCISCLPSRFNFNFEQTFFQGICMTF
jgi:hypothetical protein